MKAGAIDRSRVRAGRRCWVGRALAGALVFAASLDAAQPPTGTSQGAFPDIAGTGNSGARIHRAIMTRPEYSGLSSQEKTTVVFFAVNTLILVESGRCAAPYSEQAAVENFLLTFLSLSHGTLQPIVALPDTRKTELVDKAAELASEEEREEGKATRCPGGRLLPDEAIKPLPERQARARNLLLRAILAANSDPSAPEGGIQ